MKRDAPEKKTAFWEAFFFLLPISFPLCSRQQKTVADVYKVSNPEK
jgi:hypothetical protein